MIRRILCLAASFLLAAELSGAPPSPKREFRAAWVATVYNIDWPSKPGLPAAEQQRELRALFDQASRTGLNAILLQVRPESDALYASRYEPWSAWLSGTQGKSPGYDPLEFAIREAHKRGLELHAWFNPFRAQSNRKRPVASTHAASRHREWTRPYGTSLWLDPGQPEVRNYVLDVIMDVVRRYDIDGVHLDDYFYPYPSGKADFPDASTFKRYGSGNKGDWRRTNINKFVSELYRRVKAEKPSVKVGISPFGIWRPGVPAGTTAGLDSYAQLYGDSRKWLAEGWLDYLSPQLYWTIDSEGQSFRKLMTWWESQNTAGRHVWPGIATERVGKDRKAVEMQRQIELIRATVRSAPGHSHWSAKALVTNKGGVRTLLERTVYANKALVPVAHWLESEPVSQPFVKAAKTPTGVTLEVAPQPAARFFAVQILRNGTWNLEVHPSTSLVLEVPDAENCAVAAVSRNGTLSHWWELDAAPLELASH
jgi:uncharacterized lipoprotein YddW (UPF0748 family)